MAGEPPGERFEAQAKIRYKAQEVAVQASLVGPSEARVRFATPLRDITPGQSLVFYQGQALLGGGIISLQEDL